ncbi:XRE family transcriptional regulator [Streptomyces sp. H27-C3]|uniref:nSTAND1 domain-containing NTPase n=1 Tax=Streptomyces sp. H27-C3 TaxID=3046305 RepID=UPI0024BB2211|nr:XRE family transcriptional regulator [Streptomyces sp. H27-C3]
MPRREQPIPAGNAALVRFAADLRQLRQEAGSPSYRALSGIAHFSVATLSGAAAGHRLPSLDVTLAYVRACGGDPDRWEPRWHGVATELAVEAARQDAPDPEHDDAESPRRAPYAGLAAFQADDSPWFFGRERLVDDLVTRVAKQRFVAVFGASGAGKSSVLRAGLLPRLLADNRTVFLFTPGPHPVEEAAILLAAPARTTPGRLHQEFTAEPRNLHRTLRWIAAEQGPEAETVLIVDQFEELFTVCRGHEERTRFIAALVHCARTANSRCRVVLGVRADFYSHCAEQVELVEAMRDAQVTVGPMSADELHRAVVEPAARAGCRVEGRLLTHLVAHAQGHGAVLPLLSHVLLETWRRRRGNLLTLDGFRASGGVEGSLAQTAETFHGMLDARQRVVARQVFLRLTAPGEGTEDTKRRVDRSELDLDDDTRVVLERAAEARLITLDGQRLEITHEALIPGWPRLRGWLTGSRQQLREHRQLTEAAAVWESLDRDPGALYRGARLTLGRQLANSGSIGLTRREQAFLEAGTVAERDETETVQRRARRMRMLVTALAVLLTLTMAMTAYAMRANQEVTQQRNHAVAQNAAARAPGLSRENPALAVQLALVAHRLSPTRTTRDGLLSTLMPSWSGHRGQLLSLAVAPDGRTMATGGGDGAVRLWDIGRPMRARLFATLPERETTVHAVEMSPRGHLLAVAGTDRKIRLWNIADPGRPVLLSTTGGHTDAVRSLAFSPDGRTLASAGDDRTARLWNTDDPRRPERLGVLKGHTRTVRCVAFSRDGRTLATAGDDETVQLWDVGARRGLMRLARWRAQSLGVFAMAFSPREDVLVTAGGGDTPVRLWTVRDRRPRQVSALTGHSDVVGSIAFSPDGRTVTTGGDDRTVRSWDVGDLAHPRRGSTLTGYRTAVSTLRFSPDGGTLYSGVYDGMVRVLPLDSPRVIADACAGVRPVITRPAWQQYLAGIPYRPPCR